MHSPFNNFYYHRIQTKRAILNKYKELNGVEYNFYKQLEYISLFRHTCIIINTILIINILAMVL